MLESLTRRLAETPADFLDAPVIGGSGAVHVAAVVSDLLLMLGAVADAAQLAAFSGSSSDDRNRLSLALLMCRLLSEDWFLQQQPDAAAVLRLLHHDAADLAKHMAAAKVVGDPDRREELARYCLARLGFRPAGETEAQAEDRLASLSSAERARILAASRKAEERARAIREALARKAAEESADKWTRE
jgi:hypothetical protein